MIKNYNDAFVALMGNEGRYSNNPLDPGGETMWGVTKRVAMKYGYTGAMIDLPQATAKIIAKQEYWDVIKGDQLDPNLAFQVFDAVYNHGVKEPSMWLQQSIGANVDGSIGEFSVAAANAIPWYFVVFTFLGYRARFYPTLNTWSTFGKGWTNRIGNNLTIAGAQS